VYSWALAFDPANISKLKSCGASTLDQAVDVFAATLQYVHKDPNSTNPADYLNVIPAFYQRTHFTDNSSAISRVRMRSLRE